MRLLFHLRTIFQDSWTPNRATSTSEEGVINGCSKSDPTKNISDQNDLEKGRDAVNGTNSNGSSLNEDIRSATSTPPVRRNMELTWCGREYCSDVIRERVTGNENNMEFEGPATGQVCYVWDDPPENQMTPSVLLLVKQGDDELLQCAAKAVNELLEHNKVQILVSPDVCARLKHYHGVDDDKIKLFETDTSSWFWRESCGDG